MTEHPTTSSFSVNSLLDISEKKRGTGGQTHLSWPPTSLTTSEAHRQACATKESSAIFATNINMNHATEKTLPKIDSNLNGTVQGYTANPSYSDSSVYGMATAVRNEWDRNNQAELKRMEQVTQTPSLSTNGKAKWNSTFHSCAYKKLDYPVAETNSHDSPKKENKTHFTLNESSPQLSRNENISIKSKPWRSSEGSEAGSQTKGVFSC